MACPSSVPEEPHEASGAARRAEGVSVVLRFVDYAFVDYPSGRSTPAPSPTSAYHRPFVGNKKMCAVLPVCRRVESPEDVLAVQGGRIRRL